MTDFPLINAAVFAVLGIVVFISAVALATRIFGVDLHREIIQERNVAAAIAAGAIALGMAWIIAATMH